MTSKRLLYIDILKGLAILGVIMVHFNAQWMCGYSPLGKLSTIGARCPQLFFIISAYLTWNHLVKKKTTVGLFYLSRFKRLAPVYYIALALGILFLKSNVSVINVLAHISFLHGLSPLWINSILNVEWFVADLAIFYLITPLLSKVIKDFRTSCVVLLCSVFISIVFTLLGNYYLGSLIEQYGDYEMFFHTYCFFNQLPVLVLGIVAYYFINFKLNDNVFCNSIKKIIVVVAIAAVITGIFVVFGLNKRVLTSSLIAGLWFFILFCGAYFVESHSKAHKYLEFIVIPLQKMGEHSYGIYLFHVLIIRLIGKYVFQVESVSVYYWLLLLVVVILLSYFVSAVIEKMVDKVIK